MDIHAAARKKRPAPPSLFTGGPGLRTAHAAAERGRDGGGAAFGPTGSAGIAPDDRVLSGFVYSANTDVTATEMSTTTTAAHHGAGEGPPLLPDLHSPLRNSSVAFSASSSHAHYHPRGTTTTGGGGGGGGHTRVHLLQRLICCAGRLHRLLRAMGLLGDADDSASLSQMLVCACATIAALLLLLLCVVAALIVILVTMVPGTERQVRQTLGPLLDLNNKPHGGAAIGEEAAPAEKHPFDVRRLVQDSGLRAFLRDAQRAEELRRRVRRNATLLAQLHKARAAREAQAGSADGSAATGAAADTGVDLLTLAQTLPELERVAYLLHQVSAHISAIHAHDPVLGLVEVGNFLLNAKGRPEALQRAAERARVEGMAVGGGGGGGAADAVAHQIPALPVPPPPSSTPAAAGGGGAHGTPTSITAVSPAKSASTTTSTTSAAAVVSADAAALLDAALKEAFVGRSEAARLRAQLRGFIGVGAAHPETVAAQPFDDLAVLQYRHAWTAWEVLPVLQGRVRHGPSTATSTSTSPSTTPGMGDAAAELETNGRPTNAADPHPATGRDTPHRRADSVANRLAMKADLYDAASIFNHVYYYPLRRYRALRSYGGDGVADTDAWYSPMAAVVQARFGAALTTNPTTTAEGDGRALQEAPLSLLAMPRLGAARAAEVARLSAAEDTALMPHGMDAAAAVNTRTIFVSLASYRDAECAPTLLHLFRAARNPHRVYVGLAQQNRAGDSPCLVPEMYAPYLCPGHPAAAGPSPQGTAAAAAAAAREARARARVLYGTGVDLSGGQDGGVAASGFDGRVCYLADQVRVRSIDSRQAKGPTYGRYMAMLLYRGEDMTLVLDSHNRFRPMWDTLGLTMQAKFSDPKAALSHYPEAYSGEGADLNPYRTTTAYLCKSFFLKVQGYPRLNGIIIASPKEFTKNNVYNDPYVRVKSHEIDAATNFRLPQPWVAGGFLLASGRVYRDVPFDPHLPYIFDGEEILYSMRLWTHGYNIYTPERGICFHLYGRAAAPKIWSESAVWYSTQDRVRQRIQFFIQTHLKGRESVLVPANSTNPYVVIDSSRYGMGKARTVAQWYRYAGGDPVAHTFDGRWCGVDTSNL